ncbi:hypothetical protein, partial [Saliniramus sp.]|uniref:hypothetical protein n=1 Tax=Saliniramus sp. TaxID=2986772 RepID=UPI002BAC3729
EIMAQLDGFRTIGSVLRREPLASLLDGAYAMFLPVRPRLQRLFGGRRDQPACTDDGACDTASPRRR